MKLARFNEKSPIQLNKIWKKSWHQSVCETLRIMKSRGYGAFSKSSSRAKMYYVTPFLAQKDLDLRCFCCAPVSLSHALKLV